MYEDIEPTTTKEDKYKSFTMRRTDPFGLVSIDDLKDAGSFTSFESARDFIDAQERKVVADKKKKKPAPLADAAL